MATRYQLLSMKDIASQVEAEAGTANDKFMTPLRTAQAISKGSFLYAADAGSTDAYVITLAPAPSAYVTGAVYHFKANTINTGACTLNVNNLGAITIKKQYDQDLADGDIKAGQLCSVIYDGTNFQLLSQTSAAASGGSTPLHVKRTSTFSTLSSTYVDVTGMSIPITSGKTYHVNITMSYNGDMSTIYCLTKIIAATSTIAIYGIKYKVENSTWVYSKLGGESDHIFGNSINDAFVIADFIVVVTISNGYLKLQTCSSDNNELTSVYVNPGTTMTLTEVQ